MTAGYNGALSLLASKRPFTAIVCANDETAIGAMKAVQENGLRVPEDISIIGFDDIESARLVTPELTTIRVDKGSMGTLAMRALAGRALDPETATATSHAEGPSRRATFGGDARLIPTRDVPPVNESAHAGSGCPEGCG